MSKSLPSFFVSKKKDIIFAIYFLPKEDLFVAFPKLFASSKNTTVRINNIDYKKFFGYEQWFLYPPARMKKYLKYIPAFDSSLFCFSKDELTTEYHPLDYPFFKISDNHTKLTNKLIDSIVKITYVNSNKIGVDGSTLLGCHNENSDIDLIIYGYDNAKKLASGFKKLNGYNGIRLYEKKDYPNILKKRHGIGYGNSKITIIEQDIRRFYGFVNGKRFSIINVLEDNDYRNINLDRKIAFQKVFEGEIQILEDSLNFVVPSIFYGIDNLGVKYRIEIISHHGINQARRKENFFIKGNLYKNIDSGENIIILAFWNRNVKQRFDLLVTNYYAKQ